jgi:hypothetical protein
MAGGMACLYVAPPDPPRQRDVEILILRQEVAGFSRPPG